MSLAFSMPLAAFSTSTSVDGFNATIAGVGNASTPPVAAVSKEYSNKSVLNFYKNKSVSYTYGFSVMFDFEYYFMSSRINPVHRSFKYNFAKHVSRIHEHHIVSIDFPFNTINRDGSRIGGMQYNYPVMSAEQPIDIKVTMEDDDRGNVLTLIQLLQQTVMNQGVHMGPKDSRLGKIFVFVLDTQGQVIGLFTAHNVFFLGSSGFSGNYEGSETRRYDLTFGTDYFEYKPMSDIPAKRFPLFNIGAALATGAIVGGGLLTSDLSENSSSVDTVDSDDAFSGLGLG